ncbi:universal stress protein [Sphingomonas sp. MMS24-J13]|uniref:universal stress protein n=1 Tax=Sphingomonas sp. MMS24-J13 TaxID=3238686 RepID=UPI0038515273
MKNILVLMHDDRGQEARLQAALDVTRAVEGHLTCLDVTVTPVIIGDYYTGVGEAMLLEDERKREAANHTIVERRLAGEQISWDWKEATGPIAPCLQDASALTDLIIVNRALDDFPLPDMRTVAGDVVVKSGKPVLVVPEASRGLDLCGLALVCWDGSPNAAAALRAAAPLLELAETVILLEVADGSVQSPAEEAAAYLSRHGVKPGIIRRNTLTGKPADIILDEIRRTHADYVVMGGFGHARFAEALFGGVTRRMLSESPVPVLLAH